jgi:hypothetical protein
MGNTPEEIEKFFEWIGDAKHPPIMEVLGGDTSNAVALAEAGRAAGQRVIVIDNYWIENDSLKDWNKRQLPAHRYDGDNLLSLRMDAKFLKFFPEEQSIFDD